MTPVLAFDLATRLGWARITSEGVLYHGAVTLRHQLNGKACMRTRIRSAEDYLPTLLQHVAWGRGEVVRERPTTRAKSAAPIRIANQLDGVLLSLCGSFLIPHASVHEIPQPSLKKWLTDNGSATKEEMIEAVEQRWALGITDDNEADAVALLFMHLEQRRAAE